MKLSVKLEQINNIMNEFCFFLIAKMIIGKVMITVLVYNKFKLRFKHFF